MILFLLKLTLLLALTLVLTQTLRRSSAALRHLICVCGLAGSLLLLLTLMIPMGTAVFRINALTIPTTARIVRNVPGFTAASVATVLRSLPWLWLGGTVLLLLRIAIGYRQVARMVGEAGTTEVAYADVSVPVVIGLRRAKILLPRGAATWPDERVDAALRHERAHIRRKDLWTLLLAHLTCALYWFHPLVWMLAAQLREEQEQACDDAVILSGFEPATYAEALVAAAQNLTTQNFTTSRLNGCPMLTQKTFRNRVARLLANGVPRVSSSSTLRVAAVVFAGTVLAIGLMHGQAQTPGMDGGVFKVGGGVSAPRLASRVDPEYSEEARAEKIAGSVLLSVVVGTDGQAHDINVVRGIGAGLDEKAVEAVQKWTFVPGQKDGEPVAVRANIEINFKLL